MDLYILQKHSQPLAALAAVVPKKVVSNNVQTQWVMIYLQSCGICTSGTEV